MAVMYYGKKQKRNIFWKDMDNWVHKAFNCKGDNIGKGILAVPHFHGNRHKKKKYKTIINLLGLVKLYYAMFKASLPLCKTIPNPLQTWPNWLATQKRWHS